MKQSFHDGSACAGYFLPPCHRLYIIRLMQKIHYRNGFQMHLMTAEQFSFALLSSPVLIVYDGFPFV